MKLSNYKAIDEKLYVEVWINVLESTTYEVNSLSSETKQTLVGDSRPTTQTIYTILNGLDTCKIIEEPNHNVIYRSTRILKDILR